MSSSETTALPRLDRSCARIRAVNFPELFDAVEVQIWTADLAGALTFVNDFAARYFGRPRDVLVGEGWQSMLHAADVPQTIEQWTRSVQTGEPYRNDFRLLRGSEKVYRWHTATAHRVIVDGVQLWLGSNVDVDAERRSAEIRQSLREQLRGEIAGQPQS